LWGASAMAALVAGLFFMRFWRQTRDRFFLVFGLAFWALCLNWVGLAATSGGDESRTYFYLVRLAAFVLILAGVADRNRAPRKTLK
ncbi:MAG: DUF5985 family protein, partial [bacterium]